MSAPADIAEAPDRDEQMLARLAELDLSACERAHERYMAAEDGPEAAEAGRTYQRFARSLRQTLAIKARLKRERDAAAREQALKVAKSRSGVSILKADIGQAIRFVAAPSEQDELLEALEREVEAEALMPGFEDGPLEALVERICARLPLDDDRISAVTRTAIFEGADLWPQTVPPPPGMRTRPPRPPSPPWRGSG